MSQRSLLRFARVDTPHLADGLFALTQGKKQRGRNRIVSTRRGALEIQFACVEPLGDLEGSVFLVSVGRAGLAGKKISSGGRTARGRNLYALLKASGMLDGRDGVMITTSMRQLIDDVGLASSGSAYRDVTLALRRLGNVIIWVKDIETGEIGNCLMLSVHRHADDLLDICMNSRIRDALVHSGFTRVDLVERFLLRTPTARLVHSFLSRWLPANCKQRIISLDALATHVWEDGIGRDKTTRRDRRRSLASSVLAINSLDRWTVSVVEGQAIIARGRDEKSTHASTRKAPTPGEKSTHPATGVGIRKVA